MSSSSLTWLDHDAFEQERMRRLFGLFEEQGTVDELGIGTIRDSIADREAVRAEAPTVVSGYGVLLGPVVGDELENDGRTVHMSAFPVEGEAVAQPPERRGSGASRRCRHRVGGGSKIRNVGDFGAYDAVKATGDDAGICQRRLLSWSAIANAVTPSRWSQTLGQASDILTMTNALLTWRSASGNES